MIGNVCDIHHTTFYGSATNDGYPQVAEDVHEFYEDTNERDEGNIFSMIVYNNPPSSHNLLNHKVIDNFYMDDVDKRFYVFDMHDFIVK